LLPGSAFDFRHSLDKVALKHDTTGVILDPAIRGLLPRMHGLDVSINRSLDLPFGNLEMQAGAINVYDRTNIPFHDVYTKQRVDKVFDTKRSPPQSVFSIL
jgi:hypothetical protein